MSTVQGIKGWTDTTTEPDWQTAEGPSIENDVDGTRITSHLGWNEELGVHFIIKHDRKGYSDEVMFTPEELSVLLLQLDELRRDPSIAHD